MQKYLETCTKCGKKIEENTIRTKGSNDAYHPDCFVCHTCGSVLHGKFFKTDDGNHLCESDFIRMIVFASKVIYQLLSNRIYVAVIISQNWISESVLRYKFVHFY